jgi:hypothetical protein
MRWLFRSHSPNKRRNKYPSLSQVGCTCRLEGELQLVPNSCIREFADRINVLQSKGAPVTLHNPTADLMRSNSSWRRQH